LVQKSIELLAVMNTRVGHVVLPDQLVLGIRIHVVLVAAEALAVLPSPARILDPSYPHPESCCHNSDSHKFAEVPIFRGALDAKHGLRFP
jgi:hypothetical protein